MAIRFSPYAIVKTLSFSSLLGADGSFSSVIETLIDVIGNSANALYQSTLNSGKITEETIFKTIGLADSVSIDETYNSRPTWGIGEPANPIVIPSNYSANISISRMTLDRLSMRDFTTSPDYWYSPKIQAFVETVIGNRSSTARAFLDYPFYTFLFVSSLEDEQAEAPIDSLKAILERNFYVFMPSDYSKRITSGDAVIMSDVRGTGKLLNLTGLIEQLKL
ncbi:MAG: hypothetical protein QXP88_00265 [Thermoproteota archaeon]